MSQLVEVQLAQQAAVAAALEMRVGGGAEGDKGAFDELVSQHAASEAEVARLKQQLDVAISEQAAADAAAAAARSQATELREAAAASDRALCHADARSATLQICTRIE